LGHFIQPDFIIPNGIDPAAWDRYAYVYNNPLNYVDPSGHAVCEGIADNGSVGNFDEYEIAKVYEEFAERYPNSGRTAYIYDYFMAIAAYHTALAQENLIAAGANLQHVLDTHNRVLINGFNGVDAAIDTAFQLGGTEIAGAVMASGVGIYGGLKANEWFRRFRSF
jgi:hypothetical protein